MHSTHRILSIAVGSTLTATKVFVRASSDPADANEIICKFIDEVLAISDLFEAELPRSFHDALSKLDDDISELKCQSPLKSKLQNLRYRLSNYCKLQVYGYNSSNYDLRVILSSLVNNLKQLELSANSLKVIKKCNSYFLISSEDFILKDIMNFGPPVSLSKFFKMWGVEEKKSIWPYSYFSSIEQIDACEEFPPRDAFFNDLKEKEMSLSDYSEAKAEFDRRKNLPNNHPDKIFNMRCWLKLYNALDVRPLVKAIGNCFDVFNRLFGQDPSCFNSLPSMALETALGLYSSNSPTAWSFKPSMNHARELFRDNINGGLGNS